MCLFEIQENTNNKIIVIYVPLTDVVSKPNFFIPSLTSSRSWELGRKLSDTNSWDVLSLSALKDESTEFCARARATTPSFYLLTQKLKKWAK